MPPDEKSILSSSHSGPRTARDLTVAQRSLFHIMREYQFGRIENMHVQAGQPLLDRGARLVRIARLDRHRADAPGGDDLQLKPPFCELFDELMRLQDCLVVRLEFRHALPLQLETTPYCRESGDPSGGEDPAPIRSTRGSRR
jgi:hypothetical protein